MSSVYMTEVEQIELIKKWWKQYQQIILTSISVILLILSGARYWQWHQHKRAEDASNAYEQLMVAFSSQDSESIQAYAQQLVSRYSGTAYADTAHLIQAKLAISSGDYAAAKQALQAVTSHSKLDILVDVAHLRMARILIYEKDYDAALAELDQVKNTNYTSLRSELRGDIYYAQSQYKKAQQAYQMAKSEIDKAGMSNLFLEMKQQNVVVALHATTPVHTAHAMS